MSKSLRSDLSTKYVTLLALTEAGLGSALHAFHIPLSGHFLSLNQGYLLNAACKELPASTKRREFFTFLFQISVLGALFKSLSPAGKKLTPMIAIATQGTLFALGTLAFGRGRVATAISMILLSLWAFLQPLLFSWLVFGRDFFEAFFWALESLSQKLSIDSRWAVGFFVGIVLAKCVAAVVIAFFSEASLLRKLSFSMASSGKRVLLKNKRTSHRGSAFAGALKDLFSPLMLLSFALMTVFFVYSSIYTPNQYLWFLLRSITAGLLIFYMLRAFPLRTLAERWQQTHPRLAKILREVETQISAHHDTEEVQP